jgi:hypothetical protein
VPSPRKLVVVNLRGQPVEIQHGGRIVVVPEFARLELEEPSAGEGQLDELVRQGAVSLQAEPAKTPTARPKRKPPAKKTPPPKPPQGGA